MPTTWMDATHADTDPDAEVAFRAIIGFVVLALAVFCANIGWIPIDTAPFARRLQDGTVRRLFAAGFVLQLGAGIWLALCLLLNAQRGTRPALVLWLVALCLFLVPVPTLREDLGAALVPLATVLLVSLLGWALDHSLRQRAT
jgi:hypothetical protein